MLKFFLIVSCFGAIIAFECSEKNRYNLTGLVQQDGVYMLNGMKFPANNVFDKTIDGVNNTFGCDCTSEPCFVKCCPLGYIKKSSRVCVPAQGMTDRVQNSELSLNFMDSYRKQLNVNSVNLVYGINCQFYVEDLNWFLQEMPSGAAEWKEVAKDFEDRWNFPHCLGAMDGKHVAITCPPNSGSQYFNYKHFFSIVLFAVTDARYNFLYVHAGVQGRISDGGVFRHTAFGKALLDQNLNIPDPEALPGREMLTPYVFLADDAFPLTENICKPYTIDLNVGSPKRVCNYRISRARRIVENSFGILASVFRILHTTIDVELKYVPHIVLACVYLHNFLRRSTRAQALYSPPGSFDCEDIDVGTLIPGSWRADDHRLTNLRTLGRNAATQAKTMRDEFMHYFMSEQGRVEWQDKYLTGASSNP